MKRSVTEAKKIIWLRLQAYVGDDELWHEMTFDDDLHPSSVEKARHSIFEQLERKL